MQEAAEQGAFIAACWELFRAMVPSLPQAQLGELRYAFLAGADTMFTFITELYDEADDDRAVDCLNNIAAECQRIRAELSLRYSSQGGHA